MCTGSKFRVGGTVLRAAVKQLQTGGVWWHAPPENFFILQSLRLNLRASGVQTFFTTELYNIAIKLVTQYYSNRPK